MSRRIQSLSLILALLAVPLALVARSYACAPQQCTMMCCLAHKRAMNMNCSGAGGSSTCAMKCNSNKNIDYGLASPLPPTQLSAALLLPAPRSAEMLFAADYRHAVSGFYRIPFEPPRL